jgi:hypothetical protein
MYLISIEEGKTAAELEEAKVISGDKMADHAKDKMADHVVDEKAAIREEKAKNTQRIRVMIFLSVCYSANTGGSGTLTGKEIIQRKFRRRQKRMSSSHIFRCCNIMVDPGLPAP